VPGFAVETVDGGGGGEVTLLLKGGDVGHGEGGTTHDGDADSTSINDSSHAACGLVQDALWTVGAVSSACVGSALFYEVELVVVWRDGDSVDFQFSWRQLRIEERSYGLPHGRGQRGLCNGRKRARIDVSRKDGCWRCGVLSVERRNSEDGEQDGGQTGAHAAKVNEARTCDQRTR